MGRIIWLGILLSKTGYVVENRVGVAKPTGLLVVPWRQMMLFWLAGTSLPPENPGNMEGTLWRPPVPQEEGSGNWRSIWLQRADGSPYAIIQVYPSVDSDSDTPSLSFKLSDLAMPNWTEKDIMEFSWLKETSGKPFPRLSETESEWPSLSNTNFQQASALFHVFCMISAKVEKESIVSSID